VKGNWCVYRPSLFCQEDQGCDNCQVAEDCGSGTVSIADKKGSRGKRLRSRIFGVGR